MSKRFGLNPQQAADLGSPHTPSRLSQFTSQDAFPKAPPLNPAGASQMLEEVGQLYPPVKPMNVTSKTMTKTDMGSGVTRRTAQDVYVKRPGESLGGPAGNDVTFNTVGNQYATPADRQAGMGLGYPHAPVVNEAQELGKIRRMNADRKKLGNY